MLWREVLESWLSLECCLEPATSSRILIQKFLVCPAPEGSLLAKVTWLRNCQTSKQTSLRCFPTSHPPSPQECCFLPTLSWLADMYRWTSDTTEREGCQEFRGTVPPWPQAPGASLLCHCHASLSFGSSSWRHNHPMHTWFGKVEEKWGLSCFSQWQVTIDVITKDSIEFNILD